MMFDYASVPVPHVMRWARKPGTPFGTALAHAPNIDSRSKWDRYGMRWDATEMRLLATRFTRGQTLKEICESMQRPPAGVLSKLVSLRLLTPVGEPNAYGHYSYRVGPGFNSTPTCDSPSTEDPVKGTTTEDITMDKICATQTYAGSAACGIVGSAFNNNVPLIEVKTMIMGSDASNMADAAIFDLIARREREIAELQKIVNKPTKLVKAIEELQAGIEKLVAYVDAR